MNNFLTETSELQIDRGCGNATFRDAILPSLRKNGFCEAYIVNEDYHSSPGISCSGIKQFIADPYAPEFERLHPETRRQTKAMADSSLLHEIALEDKDFVDDEDVVEGMRADGVKNPRATKAYKEWRAGLEDAGTSLVKPEERLMIDSFKSVIDGDNFIGAAIRAANIKEKAHYVVESQSGMILKCKPDAFDPHSGRIIDLKFSREGRWTNTVAKYGYDIQDAFYTYVMSLINPLKYDVGHEMRGIGYKFIFVEFTKAPPFRVGAKRVGTLQAWEAFGRVGRALNDYKKALETGDWGKPWDESLEEAGYPDWRREELGGSDDS